MGHAVYHRTASGEAQLEDVSSLEAALELVERLRNEDGPKDVRVFKEIPIEVRTYYRVVAAADGEPASEATQTTAEVVNEQPAVEATSELDEMIATADVEVDEAPQTEVVEDEVPAPSSSSLSEPPAGAMPLLSPPPPAVTVHADDDEDEPTAAGASSGRSKLFNRG